MAILTQVYPKFTVNFFKIIQGKTRCLPIAYSMYLGIKDVSTSNQRRFKDVHERLCTEVNRFLLYDYLVITLTIHFFFI